MRRRGISLAAILCLAATLGCGGGSDPEPLSEVEYFARLEGILDIADVLAEQEEAWGRPPPRGPELDAWAFENRLSNHRALADEYRNQVEKLEDIEPPESLTAEHAMLLSSTRAMVAANEEIVANLEALTLSEFKWSTGDWHEPNGDAAREQETAFCAIREAGDAIGIRYDPGCASFPPGFPDQTIEVAPGIRGTVSGPPRLPDGLAAATQYIDFVIGGENAAVAIALPLIEPTEDVDGFAWYSYLSNVWVRLEPAVVAKQDGRVVEGDFQAVPENLIVLREE